MMLQMTTRSARLPSSPHAIDRLWPSFSELRKNLLSDHSKALPDTIRNSLLAMDEDTEAKTQQQSTTGFSYNDEKNLHRIGVMTRRVNTFFERQMTKNTSEAVYTPASLDAYDAMVWDFNSPFHWRIHRQEIDALYQQGLEGAQRHCEVAVGTGLFLREWANQSHVDAGLEQLTLMDLSPSSLEGCYQRLQTEEYFVNHVSVEKVQANILESPPRNLRGIYDSVAANFLLHCLPGNSLLDKYEAIQSCASLLKPSGSFFGSTILGKDLEVDAAAAGPHALATNKLYNQLGIFGNSGDTFEDIAVILNDLFYDVTIFQIGYCAVWLARNPKLATTTARQ